MQSRSEKSRWGLAAIWSVCALCTGVGATPALAQVSKQLDDNELAARSEDPTAALMSFEINDWYEASLYDEKGTINQAMARAVVPFTVGSVDNIFRITQQDTTQAYNNKLGGSDPELIYLAGTPVSWGRWGIGAVLEPPSGSEELTSNKWSAGPSAGIENTSDPRQRWGVFLRGYTSFAGSDKAKKVGIVNLQPLYVLKLGEGRALSLGETEAVYDTNKSRWKTLQVGLKFGQVVTIAGHKWKPTAEADYDFCKTSGN